MTVPEVLRTLQQAVRFLSEKCRPVLDLYGHSRPQRRRNSWIGEPQQLEPRELLTVSVDLVLDTNVLLSALLWRNTPHTLLEQAREPK